MPLPFVDALANSIVFKSIKVLGREMDSKSCMHSENIHLDDLQ